MDRRTSVSRKKLSCHVGCDPLASSNPRLRLGNDSSTSSVTITSDQYALAVNGTQYSYTTMTFAGTSNLTATQTTNFRLLELCHISLKKGTNTLRFDVANEAGGQGGTQDAIAPIVDCMTIYVPEGVTLSYSPRDNVSKYDVAHS